MDVEPRDARVLFDFVAPEAARGWRSIDDVVMGGVSRSRFERAEPGLGVFTGEVSLEHGGGFASVRSPDALDGLAGFDGVELELRGDGRRYKLNVRLGRDLDGVVWQRAFPTSPGTWARVRIGFDALEPTFRGRRVPGAGPFDPARAASIGLVVGDRQAGAFRLELRRVSAFRDAARA